MKLLRLDDQTISYCLEQVRHEGVERQHCYYAVLGLYCSLFEDQLEGFNLDLIQQIHDLDLLNMDNLEYLAETLDQHDMEFSRLSAIAEGLRAVHVARLASRHQLDFVLWSALDTVMSVLNECSWSDDPDFNIRPADLGLEENEIEDLLSYLPVHGMWFSLNLDIPLWQHYLESGLGFDMPDTTVLGALDVGPELYRFG